MNATEMFPELRERLLEAVLHEFGEKGRGGIALPDLLAAQGVSGQDFAAEFDDLDVCLDAAYDQLTARIDQAVRLGCVRAWPSGGEPRWPDRVRGGLETLLAQLAENPLRARTLLRAYPSLGPEARARYHAFLDDFVPLLAPGRAFSGMAGALPAGVETLAVGAAEAIVFEEVDCGRTADLPALLPSILFSVLVPFLGATLAAEEAAKAER